MADFDIEFCPHCGEEINYTANTCSVCGADLPLGASYCPNCGEEVERYNQLSQEEKTALREAWLKKKSEEMAADEALQKELEEKRRKDREQYGISKAQDEALINEITDEIKSQITFDCKLEVSLTLYYIEIQAKIVDTGYTLSKSFLQKDRATALPKFVKALIAIYEVVGK